MVRGPKLIIYGSVVVLSLHLWRYDFMAQYACEAVERKCSFSLELATRRGRFSRVLFDGGVGLHNAVKDSWI